MTIEPRLVVTGHRADGAATFVEDSSPAPVTVAALPGAEFYLMWGTADGTPTLGADRAAPVREPYFPGVGGSRVIFLRWAPHADEPEPVTDAAGAHAEAQQKLPGLVDVFEEGGEGMHTTDTIDYAVCLAGELVLTLDNDEEVTLRPGTCVVQLGTRHRWTNRSDASAFMCYVQIGAERG